jgi:predicted unusual protein kinase regulating ubiquinone biosynthesis (AarF/ABC1/UbiB family)
MVARLTQEESNNFIGLLSSVGEGDGRTAAEAALRFSMENKLSQKEREEFVADMQEMFAERCKGYGTQVDVGLVLRGILSLIRKHRVRIDANYATLAVNCLCVESLARRVCPDYNLLDAAKPLLRKYRSIRFQPDGTPKPASAAQDLVSATDLRVSDKRKMEELTKAYYDILVVETLDASNECQERFGRSRLFPPVCEALGQDKSENKSFPQFCKVKVT